MCNCKQNWLSSRKSVQLLGSYSHREICTQTSVIPINDFWIRPWAERLWRRSFPHRQQGPLWGSSSPLQHVSRWELNHIKLACLAQLTVGRICIKRYLQCRSECQQFWSRAYCYAKFAVSSPAVTIAYPGRMSRLSWSEWLIKYSEHDWNPRTFTR